MPAAFEATVLCGLCGGRGCQYCAGTGEVVVPDPEPEPPAPAVAPWWFDFDSSEVVRRVDGMRWRAEDLPTFPVPPGGDGQAQLAAFDAWVVAQPGRDR